MKNEESLAEFYLENRLGTAKKFYRIWVERKNDYFIVKTNYGRIGSKGITKDFRFYCTTRNANYRAVSEMRKKLISGYKAATALDRLAGVAKKEINPDRKIKVNKPHWDTRNKATIKRLAAISDKLIDQCNMIISDRRALDYDTLKMQVNRSLKSYITQVNRMAKTKTHGRFITDDIRFQCRHLWDQVRENYTDANIWPDVYGGHWKRGIY